MMGPFVLAELGADWHVQCRSDIGFLQHEKAHCTIWNKVFVSTSLKPIIELGKGISCTAEEARGALTHGYKISDYKTREQRLLPQLEEALTFDCIAETEKIMAQVHCYGATCIGELQCNCGCVGCHGARGE
jgi:hypothetical protein